MTESMTEVKTYNIYLLRHGKTQGAPALYGHTDVAVSIETQQSIRKTLTTQNLGFTAIETSPLKRCQALAQQLVDDCPALALTVTDNWKETHFGDLDGVPFEAAQSDWPKFEAFWRDPAIHVLPNAEPLEQFYHRISQAWDSFTQALDQDTLVICHGGTIRMILAHVLQLDYTNPLLYSTLHIDHQTLTHIQLTQADKNYLRVRMIGQPLI
ncbi:alpha-ribazole-5'-phosphate phosphatase [Vibrio orientalis CIP 102891 = ATCC 33934]|uniref:Alpha-ribazole-5'-phosphate phosphatase n=1 Tax=Vibrio orientalis CIP 102891 = ATCC 33934 TaxID=675816 RepID=C9QHQ7_VIBOR|nr:histidine phosphatase family protein [Vibrio orientalis]EEX92228.1 alpha-ribazole-5'-phosphate phosphatase [Vibrio orientalis CIP 102891 = ATCC 33934]EGU53261.1 alpha-ribazole-5'-phosphate phosphatase [Vibrio orientalis CIP 102891 = ATCC 33934]